MSLSFSMHLCSKIHIFIAQFHMFQQVIHTDFENINQFVGLKMLPNNKTVDKKIKKKQ